MPKISSGIAKSEGGENAKKEEGYEKTRKRVSSYRDVSSFFYSKLDYTHHKEI